MESSPTCTVLVHFFGILRTRNSLYASKGRLTLCAVRGRSPDFLGRIRSALEVDVTDQKSECRLSGVALELTSKAIPRKTIRMHFMALF